MFSKSKTISPDSTVTESGTHASSGLPTRPSLKFSAFVSASSPSETRGIFEVYDTPSVSRCPVLCCPHGQVATATYRSCGLEWSRAQQDLRTHCEGRRAIDQDR